MKTMTAASAAEAEKKPADAGRSSGAGRIIPCRNYDLDGTFQSGQLFRWEKVAGHWEGLLSGRWIRLREDSEGIAAEVSAGDFDWAELEAFLGTGEALEEILKTFPDDAVMREAVRACRGLRLVRQDPWECLASFILSSTKQIIQIRQIVGELCARFGDDVSVPSGTLPRKAFPSPARLAVLDESTLRQCRMGFRAPFLLAAARAVDAGHIDLANLGTLEEDEARDRLIALRGVGRKIADCVLLFACGFPRAFPVDVWVSRALRELYFGGREVTERELLQFSRSHFGPRGGYAQQYLFHYMRVHRGGRSSATTHRGRTRSLVSP